LIAAVTSPNSDFVRTGKLITMASALLCAALTFVFTYVLWRSREVAAVAMLWFSFARGLFPISTAFVSPDFLFAVFVLLCFIVLIRCFRRGSKLDWFALGAVHAVAYLAKAFALPWLAVSTVLAAALAYDKSRWKQALASVALAALLPLAVALSWGSVLHSKYGVFTTGSQLKANLLQWTLDVRFDPHDKGYETLRDLSPLTDRYGIVDPMPPGSPAWKYPTPLKRLLPAIMRSELNYLPAAVKETLVVVTVGGVLAFMFGLLALFRNRERAPTEFRVVAVVAIDSVVLVLTYCMLVFDGRYLYPIIPLIIGSATPFLFWKQGEGERVALPALARCVCLALVVAGIIFTLTYRSSPYRMVTRDYQPCCYQAGRLLGQSSGQTVVSFGVGPYPEHGVGWEVALKSAFFADQKIVAMSPTVPAPGQDQAAVRDVQRSGARAVLIYGPPNSQEFSAFVTALRSTFAGSSSQAIDDPVRGQVGVVVLLEKK
jgi:hypothetical protein